MLKKIIKTSIAFLVFAIFASTTLAQSGSIISTNVSGVTSSSATLRGEVNPNGYISTMWFEYGTDSNLYSWNETEHLAIDDINYPITLARTIGGLRPSTAYYFRTVIDNGRNETKGNIFYFVTSQAVSSQTGSNTFPDNSNNVNYNEATQAEDTSDSNENVKSALSANAIFGGGFLPDDLIGWLILIFIAIAIMYLVKKTVQN